MVVMAVSDERFSVLVRSSRRKCLCVDEFTNEGVGVLVRRFLYVRACVPPAGCASVALYRRSTEALITSVVETAYAI